MFGIKWSCGTTLAHRYSETSLVCTKYHTVWERCVELQVTNSSPTPVKLFHGTNIGQFTPLEQVQVVDTVQEQSQHATPFPSDIDLSTSSLSAPQKELGAVGPLAPFQPCLCSGGGTTGKDNGGKTSHYNIWTSNPTTTMPIASIPQGGGRQGDPGYVSNRGDSSEH